MNTGDPIVLRPAQRPTYERGGGARTTPLVSASLGAGSFITGITELDAGAAIPFHSHNCEESVVLLEGEAVLEVGGVEHRLVPFDATLIRGGLIHRFRNPGPKPMKILWIYGSAQATRTLQETGETRPVSAEHG